MSLPTAAGPWRLPRREPATVLVCHDRAERADAVAEWLGGYYDAVGVDGPFESLEAIGRLGPDVVVVSSNLAGLVGEEFPGRLRREEVDVGAVLLETGSGRDDSSVADASGESDASGGVGADAWDVRVSAPLGDPAPLRAAVDRLAVRASYDALAGDYDAREPEAVLPSDDAPDAHATRAERRALDVAVLRSELPAIETALGAVRIRSGRAGRRSDDGVGTTR